MKITKSQLKLIIKEEISKVLQEYEPPAIDPEADITVWESRLGRAKNNLGGLLDDMSPLGRWRRIEKTIDTSVAQVYGRGTQAEALFREDDAWLKSPDFKDFTVEWDHPDPTKGLMPSWTSAIHQRFRMFGPDYTPATHGPPKEGRDAWPGAPATHKKNKYGYPDPRLGREES